jgi:hypothetical protein
MDGLHQQEVTTTKNKRTKRRDFFTRKERRNDLAMGESNLKR